MGSSTPFRSSRAIKASSAFISFFEEADEVAAVVGLLRPDPIAL